MHCVTFETPEEDYEYKQHNMGESLCSHTLTTDEVAKVNFSSEEHRLCNTLTNIHRFTPMYVHVKRTAEEKLGATGASMYGCVSYHPSDARYDHTPHRTDSQWKGVRIPHVR